MNLRRLALIITILSTISCPLFAQTDPAASTTQTVSGTAPKTQIGRVLGKLVDAQKKPVSYATVTLLRTDSSVVNGDLTKDDGSFSISPTGTGNFILKIDAIGMKSKSVPVAVTADAPIKDIGSITVGAGTTNLKGVTVVGEKPLMQMSVDKKVFNVEQNITTAGGSATDVLSNVPSVSVDVDGNVSLRNNSNVTVLIDGKPSTLLGTDQASALQSLPASSIESVEVITNPSAKYDAQGTTGIINIITKKNTKFGINGNVTLGAATGDKYNGALGLSVKKGKWNVYLNSSFRLNDNYNNTTSDRYNHISYVDAHGNPVSNDSSYHTYEHAQRHFDGSFNSVGATYNFNKNSSITLTQNVNIMSFGYVDSSNYLSYGSHDETSGLSTLQRRFSSAGGGPQSYSSALDYTTKFKKEGEELNVDATYAFTNYTRTLNFLTGINSPSGYDGPIYESAPATGGTNSFNAWADYTDPLFTKNGKLGLGFKSQFYSFTSSNNPIIDSPNGQSYTDYSLLNKYNYSQQIHAAYANWNDQQGKFTYQAGLRMEYSEYSGTDEVLSTSKYTNSFLNLFPSAFISYQLPNQQSIYLNYSRRTNRPSFFQLLPFKDVSNPGLVSEGNPDLIPEFIHHVEFSYNKQTSSGANFLLSAYYQYTQNLIERITYPIDTGVYAGSLFTQPQNLAQGTTYGLEATGHMQILPIWDATVDLNFFQNVINIGNVDSTISKYISDQAGFSWFGKINTNLKLPGGFTLQINGNYESPKVIAQGTMKEIWWVDAALRKNLWNNKATIVANVSDIFNTRKYTTLYNLPTYDETYYRDRETRVGTLTFTYRFGSTGNNATKGRGKQNMNNNNKPQTPEERENNLKQGDDNSGDQGMGGGGNSGGNGGSGNSGGSSGGGPHGAHS